MRKLNIQYTGRTVKVFTGKELDGSDRYAYAGLARARINGVEYLLLDNKDFADALYGQATSLHWVLRSVFLSYGALEIMKMQGIYPDIVIGNDWMCAPLMALLNSRWSLYKQDSIDPHFKNTETIGPDFAQSFYGELKKFRATRH